MLIVNIIGDELLLNFWREISALICNFTCEITKLPWQPFRTLQCQNGDEVLMNEDVRAQRDALENLNTQENIKKDSNRYFAEKFGKILNFISQI